MLVFEITCNLFFDFRWLSFHYSGRMSVTADLASFYRSFLAPFEPVGDYTDSPFYYHRRASREVMVGSIGVGGSNPIRIQSMTTTDTLNTEASVKEAMALFDAGCEIVRLTAQGPKEANNLKNIKDALIAKGYTGPLVADIHFSPRAAMIAAEHVEKVRINPGNFADTKRFEHIDYTDDEYCRELERIHDSFKPLVLKAKELGRALRIGVNHGSLSDRIMNRYGDTPIGMVESAIEFLKIAELYDFRNMIVSMKASNPYIMIQAYRMLVERFRKEKMDYPLHLGVTEAGDGRDGRIKSAVGIGTLLLEGIGDTIRVSLTEDAVYEIPAAVKIVEAAQVLQPKHWNPPVLAKEPFLTSPYEIQLRPSKSVSRSVIEIGADHPVRAGAPIPLDLEGSLLSDFFKAAPDYLFVKSNDEAKARKRFGELFIETPDQLPQVNSLAVVVLEQGFQSLPADDCGVLIDESQIDDQLLQDLARRQWPVFVMLNTDNLSTDDLNQKLNRLTAIQNRIIGLNTQNNPVYPYRLAAELLGQDNPPPFMIYGNIKSVYDAVFRLPIEAGGLFLSGIGNLLAIGPMPDQSVSTGLPFDSAIAYQTVLDILQATRMRITKTEFISCPSCGRTLFDLQSTTARIKEATGHLKGVRIAVMGCIVNGPGEMADADFGYVGAGPGKITLYKGKEVVRKNIESDIATDELIQLIKESGMWHDP